MIILKKFIIDQIDTNAINIQWEFEQTIEDLSNYSLTIFRSESPGVVGLLSGFDLVVASLPVSQTSYIDRSLVGLATPGRLWYYKLKIVNATTQEESIQPSTAEFFKSRSLDLGTREVLRQKTLVLEKFVGRKCFALKRKTWGTHCTRCWDDVLFRSTDPNCPECQGTGWSTGYLPPTSFLAMITPSPERNQIMMFGEWKPSDVLLEMLNYPPLREKDVIIDDSGKRWVVVQIQKVEKLGYLLEQKVQLALIEYDDIVYNLPIDYNTPIERFKYR